MKKLLLFLVFCHFLFVSQSIQAQINHNEPPILPLNPSLSPLFGKDIVINNLPNQEQKILDICSAPNGWLYAVYSLDSLARIGYTFMRSKDNGLTWNQLYSFLFQSIDNSFYKFNLIACGNSDSNQQLIFSYSGRHKNNLENYDFTEVIRFSCDPFTKENNPFYSQSPPFENIAVAWDNTYPALGATPNSMGFLFSTKGTKDSIIFVSSADGGMTINNHQVVAVSTKTFHKVALTYGRSPSQNAGQYFAAWEEQADTSSNLGHIYTSHTTPNFNSHFTTPVMLDGLDPSLVNICRNPVIACQANNVDNDSTNLSEVVLFEKFNSGSGDYDIMGFYNKKAASGATFKRLNVATTPNNELQPDITFNPFDSTFIVTYYDSTTQKLLSLSKNLNLGNPDTWHMVSPGYNDSFSLVSPNPKVKVNMANQKEFYGWIANRTNGHGVALLDAPYIPNAGLDEHSPADVARLIGVYPNPCNTTVTVSFEIKKSERVVITLCNLVGQPVGTLTDQTRQPGLYKVKYDLSGFQTGIYFYTLTAGTFSTSGKMCVIR